MVNGFHKRDAGFVASESPPWYTATMAPETSGICEYHRAYAFPLKLVYFHTAVLYRIVNPIDRMSVTGPTYICNSCQRNMYGLFREASVVTGFKKMEIEEYTMNPRHQKIAKAFLNLKDGLSCVSEVCIVPWSSLRAEYTGKLNISLDIPSFSALSYGAWAINYGKSVMDLWNDEKTRTKFWSAKVTRLLIALGRIQHDTKDLEIWIRSYGRLFHINYFVYPQQGKKLLKIIPENLIRLGR